MSSKQRGKEDSKELVMCEYCNLKTRKDNLKRHTDTQHPGSNIKWKRIVSQKSKLTDFFGNVSEVQEKVEETPEPEELEDTADGDNNYEGGDFEEERSRN